MDGRYIVKVGEKVQNFNEFLVRLIHRTSDLKLTDPLPRTSTPLPRRKNSRGMDNEPYARFVRMLEEGQPSPKVRGMSRPTRDIIGGNVVPFVQGKRQVEEPKVKISVYRPITEFKCGR